MEALRFQIFLWLLNYWRMYRPEHFDMADAWREICESMPPIPECAREGCDTILFGYRSHAIYCCRAHATKAWFEMYPDYQRDYKQKPEYKAQQKVYCQRPEVKAKILARRETPENRAYMKDYHARKKAERLAAEEQNSP